MIISYDIITYPMTTVSVPLPADLLIALEQYIAQHGPGKKADVMRRALKFYLEQQAVENVLRAAEGPFLSGNLRDLARKV